MAKKKVNEQKIPKKMGRPRVTVNWDLFDDLCEVQCTEKEIASILKVSIDTLAKIIKREKKTTFKDYYAEKSAGGKHSLRRRQFRLAEDGSVPMQIWLGKQWLGQCETQAIDLKSSDGSMSPQFKESREVYRALQKKYGKSELNHDTG